MMRAYELMVIIDGDVDDPKAQTWIKTVSDGITAAGGTIHGRPDWWGKRPFAYPINKKSAGYYLVVELPGPRWRPRRARADAPSRGRRRPPQADPSARGRGRTTRHHGRRCLTGSTTEGSHPMASNSNSITLVGNLTRDPELRFTTGGRGVASFGLAVNRRYQVNGEWQEQVSFFNVVAWGELGENVAATLTKGSRAIVFGRLEQREYTNREGEKRTTSRSSPTRSARACAGRRPRSSATSAPPVAAAVAAVLRWRSGGGGRAPDPIYGDEEPF
jgi:single-strand DNA-binding protein